MVMPDYRPSHWHWPGGAACFVEPWTWQVAPLGLVYRSYLAGVKEPRLATVWFHEKNRGWLWDSTLGGRVGLLRYGTRTAVRPDGWQLDVEAAAFPRLDPNEDRDLVASDFRAGIPLTYGDGPYRVKFAYYHLSSHLGDELLLKNPDTIRLNFTRDVLVWGHSYYLTDDWRIYGEVGWAFYDDGGAEPWEFQFGLEYSPLRPSGLHSAPFLALNGHLRQELNFGGNFVLQAGWQWRATAGEQLIRTGLQYYNGGSPQSSFFRASEQQIGIGLWYDY
jgi:hypothetical protein